MNKIERIMILFAMLLSSACNFVSNESNISFEKELYDFGVINQNAPIEIVFKYKNSGEKDLIITDIKTSCGCTVPNWSKTITKPEAKGEISVTYDAQKLGRFDKTIVVYYDEGKKSKALKIKGFVKYTE